MRAAVASLGLLIGLVGLGLDFAAIVPAAVTAPPGSELHRSLPDALIWFWTFFTHLSNLGLVLVYAAVLTPWRWLGWFRKPRTMALMGGYILLVMVYYHFMLAPFYVFEGMLLWATIILHYVAPIFYLVWWVAFAPHGRLSFRETGWMLVPGLIYAGWVLARGAVTGDYPYEVVDPRISGYGRAIVGVGVLMLAVAVCCAIVVAADKALALLARKTAT